MVIAVGSSSNREVSESTGCGCWRRWNRKDTPLKDLSAEEILNKFDANKDGVIDQKELNKLMEAIVIEK
jgi:hypothetical protein